MIDGTPLPNAISLVVIDGKQTIRVLETVPELTGVYTVLVTVLDPKSGIQNVELTQEMTVKCTKSLKLVTNPISPLIVYTINTSQLITTTQSVPDYEPYPNNCLIGLVTYSIARDPDLLVPNFIT